MLLYPDLSNNKFEDQDPLYDTWGSLVLSRSSSLEQPYSLWTDLFDESMPQNNSTGTVPGM